MNAEMNMDKEMNTNAKPLFFVFALLQQASIRKIASNLVFPVVRENQQENPTRRASFSDSSLHDKHVGS